MSSDITWHESPTEAHNVLVLNGVVYYLHVEGWRQTRRWTLLDTGLVKV